MIYGYARVSSKGQLVNGNSLDDQRSLLLSNGAVEIIEECCTGSIMQRPKLDALIGRLQRGDTLMVTKYDRFARTCEEGTALVESLVKRGITIHILNMGVVQDSSVGKLILQIMLAFAEFERSMIVERTTAGKAIARQKPGYRDGRPEKFSKAQRDHALSLLGEYSYTQVADMTGISKSTLLRAKRKRDADG